MTDPKRAHPATSWMSHASETIRDQDPHANPRQDRGIQDW